MINLTVIRWHNLAFRLVLVEFRFLVVVALLASGNCAATSKIALQFCCSQSHPHLQLLLKGLHQLRLFLLIQLPMIARPLTPEDDTLDFPYGFVVFPNAGDQDIRIVPTQILAFCDVLDGRAATSEGFDCLLQFGLIVKFLVA